MLAVHRGFSLFIRAAVTAVDGNRAQLLGGGVFESRVIKLVIGTRQPATTVPVAFLDIRDPAGCRKVPQGGILCSATSSHIVQPAAPRSVDAACLEMDHAILLYLL